MTTINYVNMSLQICGCGFSVVTLLCLFVSKNPKTICNRLYYRMLILNTAAMMFDIFALVFRGKLTDTAFVMVRLSNMTAYICNYILVTTFVHYLTEFIKERIYYKSVFLSVTRLLCIVSVSMVILTQFVPVFYSIDKFNIYHREKFFWVSQVMGIVCMLFCCYVIIRFNKIFDRQEKFALCSYFVLPVTALIIQIFSYGLVFLNLANTTALIIVFLFLQLQQGQRIERQEKEMAETRINIMLSQMQPHFLNNALNAIYHLCNKDPQLARKTIKDFSIYLRNNLDSITRKSPVLFETELEHIRTYLSIEKLRFDDELNIVYDIEVSAFMLPAMTVQPIVENAVKYGVCQSQDGGTVTIATRELVDCYHIIISDDGEGFDVTQKKKDNRSHIGIENVRQRLQMMCGGKLLIKSQIGKGTQAIISIPKEENKQ